MRIKTPKPPLKTSPENTTYSQMRISYLFAFANKLCFLARVLTPATKNTSYSLPTTLPQNTSKITIQKTVHNANLPTYWTKKDQGIQKHAAHTRQREQNDEHKHSPELTSQDHQYHAWDSHIAHKEKKHWAEHVPNARCNKREKRHKHHSPQTRPLNHITSPHNHGVHINYNNNPKDHCKKPLQGTIQANIVVKKKHTQKTASQTTTAVGYKLSSKTH